MTIHDEILQEFGGFPGFAGIGVQGVGSALERVQNRIQYARLDDAFGIAALYAEVIARGHVFNDGNKRTGLALAVTYLSRQGIHIPKDPTLEEVMVSLAEGVWTCDDFAWYLSELADLENNRTA